jgi:hypothetical protein
MAFPAEVADFYHIDPTRMSTDEVMGLRANIKKRKAQRVLDEACVGKIHLSADGWFDFVWEATGDLAQAEHAHFVAAKASLQRGGDGLG